MKTPRLLRIVVLGVCLIGLPIWAYWMRGRVLEAENVSQEFWSRVKFRHIEAMLLLYHEQHGVFPPTKYQPQPGGPIHSWRVLLLPHAGASFKERYAAYDFSQESNSSNNWQALKGVPDLDYFSMDGGNTALADYFTIGDGDEWPSKRGRWKRPLRSYLVEKGEDRFLLVEDPDSMIFWTEPKY